MLNPGFDSGAIIETFQQLYRDQRWVMVPSLLADDDAARLRARLQDAVAPFYIADRGRYRVSDAGADEELFSSLLRFAEVVVGEPLARVEHRWLRFAHGDYQLTQGDNLDRGARGRHLEATLDFSTGATGQGEIVFTDGSSHFLLPQLPLSVALVERRDSLYRYHRYFNHLIGDAEIWRLRLSLSFSR